MTFEELNSIYNDKLINHISASTINDKVYVRFHLGNPCFQYIKKNDNIIYPEEIKNATAPGDDEEVLESVYEYFKTYTYYEKICFYENYIVIVGWVPVSLNEGNIDPDDDTLITLIGGNFCTKENIDFVNKIFIGHHISNIHPIINEENGNVESVSILFSNGMRISDSTSYLNQYSEAQIYLTEESKSIYYAFTEGGIIQKTLG